MQQLVQHRRQIVEAARDQAEAQLVVDVGGDRRLLGEQLGDDAVALLAAPGELDDRVAGGADLLDHLDHLGLDEAEHLVVGDRQLEEQLAAGEVVHDVHRP